MSGHLGHLVFHSRFIYLNPQQYTLTSFCIIWYLYIYIHTYMYICKYRYLDIYVRFYQTSYLTFFSHLHDEHTIYAHKSVWHLQFPAYLLYPNNLQSYPLLSYPIFYLSLILCTVSAYVRLCLLYTSCEVICAHKECNTDSFLDTVTIHRRTMYWGGPGLHLGKRIFLSSEIQVGKGS